MFQSIRIHLILLLTGSLLAGCAAPAATAVPTAAPTATLAPTATPAPTLEPSDSERKLTVDGAERSYLLHIPSGLDSLQPVPIVLAFHGAGAEPSAMDLMTGFNDIAEEAGFIVVYPEGLGLTWNAGTCCGYAMQKNVDDIAFVRQMLDDLQKTVQVDVKRIYATGFSNGGGFAYRLACEMPDTFAAVAPVAGAMLYSPCQPQGLVSLITVHGLADATVPYEGGGELEVPPVEQVMTTWAKFDGCAASPQTEKKEKIFVHTVYPSCESGTAVERYAMESGGHAWPSKYVWPASEAIWEFFAAHPKP